MYDRVLFPTDRSEAAEAAATHAYSHADHYDVGLHVLHVISANETIAIVGHGATGSTHSKHAVTRLSPPSSMAQPLAI